MKWTEYLLIICVAGCVGCTIEVRPLAKQKQMHRKKHAVATGKASHAANRAARSEIAPYHVPDPTPTPNWTDRYWPHKE
jgi:hypothetical protein